MLHIMLSFGMQRGAQEEPKQIKFSSASSDRIQDNEFHPVSSDLGADDEGAQSLLSKQKNLSLLY